MPVRPCSQDGKSGYRWGGRGACYTYPAGDQRARKRAKQRAYIQGYAAGHGSPGHGSKAFEEWWLSDPELWREMRAVLLPRIERLFRQAFIQGAEMGAMQRPAREARGERALDEAAEIVERGLRQLEPGAETVLPFDPEAINVAADNVIANYTDEWWEQFSQSTQRSMRRIFQRANALGLTNAEVARELEPLFGAVRAQRIAVSELTNILGLGAQETYRQAGYGEWEWRTVRDSKVDDVCRRLDKRRFPISVRFQRAHVGCRCFPVAAGQASLVRLGF